MSSDQTNPETRSPSDGTPSAEPQTADFTNDAVVASAAAGAPASAPEVLPAAPSEFEAQAQEGFADDGDFAEHYRLLFASVAIFVGTMWLPIEGRYLNLFAKDSISGGFLAVFSAYGILAAWMNIHNRKMIMWPMLFAALDGLYLTITREMALIRQFQADPASANAQPIEWVRIAGPGLYVIFFGCLVVLWTLVTGVAKGAKKAKERAEAAKSNRAARKGA